MKNFSLKIFSNGLYYKYRFEHAQQLNITIVKALRDHKYIARAWLHCKCHNVEIELKGFPLGSNSQRTAQNISANA